MRYDTQDKIEFRSEGGEEILGGLNVKEYNHVY
jgi:hypothetical protein